MQSQAQAAAEGDRAAFDQLHARLSAGLVRHFAKRAGWDDELAGELAQRTWTIAWQALSNGRYDPGRAAFSTFLYAIGSKVWLQHGRSRRAGTLSIDHGASKALDAADEGDDPADVLEECELLDAVREALRRDDGEDALTEQEKHIVRRASQGATDRALAAELGLAASTVNVRKQGAYGKIRRMLSRQGFSDEAGERGEASRE